MTPLEGQQCLIIGILWLSIAAGWAAFGAWRRFTTWMDTTACGLADADAIYDVYDHHTDAPVWDESFTAADIREAHTWGAQL